MDFKELVEGNRSRRRFDQSRPVSIDTLIDLVELARLTPSAKNMQPLKYAVTASPEQCAEIFPLLGWAGYLKDWKGPKEGERPTAYITIVLDKSLANDPFCDHGIASQTIMLGAVEKGLGGCIIATVNRKKLSAILGIEEHHEILLVLALGVPAEEVVIEPLSSEQKIEYWRSSDGVHHVPKRPLDALIISRDIGKN